MAGHAAVTEVAAEGAVEEADEAQAAADGIAGAPATAEAGTCADRPASTTLAPLEAAEAVNEDEDDETQDVATPGKATAVVLAPANAPHPTGCMADSSIPWCSTAALAGFAVPNVDELGLSAGV